MKESEYNLPRKYRPQQFADLAQPTIAKILEAHILSGNHKTPYLFTGPSGAGKTTLARLMAMSMLCDQRSNDTAEPIISSKACQAILNDAHRDVIEINCADHNGVDDVRDKIAAKIHFMPTMGDFLIFILDECHMLTTQAQNALLKILEDTPPHVRFILCTTEIHKMLTTIRSRCRNFVVQKTNDNMMLDILEKVSKQENIEYTKEALQMIVDESDGNIRTALTVLEQVADVGANEQIVADLLCRSPKTIALKLILAIADGKRSDIVNIINDVKTENRNVDAITSDMHDLLMAYIANQLTKKKDQYTDRLSTIKPQNALLMSNLLINEFTTPVYGFDKETVVMSKLLFILGKFQKAQEKQK